jgi:hypothetical protein
LNPVSLAQYLPAAQTFLASPSAFTDGNIAYSDRAIGDLSRPFFPDGIDGAPNGPFSKPAGQWSIFSDRTAARSVDQRHPAARPVRQRARRPVPLSDPGLRRREPAQALRKPCRAGHVRLANGLQIFPGSVPIYRGAALIGAVGVSGDGVDQDDMVAFLGLERASLALNGSRSRGAARTHSRRHA